MSIREGLLLTPGQISDLVTLETQRRGVKKEGEQWPNER